MWVHLAFILAASAPSPKGAPFVSDEILASAPGPEWTLQTSVPGAPGLAGAYVLPRAGTRSSLVTFGIDPKPEPPDPEAYEGKAFEPLSKPPLSFVMLSKQAVTWKKRAAFRMEYADSARKRRFVQIAIPTPKGAIVIATLQSPDEAAFKEDQAAFARFVDGIDLRQQ